MALKSSSPVPGALSVCPLSGALHASSCFSPKPPGSRCRSYVLTCGSHVWQKTWPQEAHAALRAAGHGDPGVCSLSQGALPFRWPCKQRATTLPWRLTWQNHHHHHETSTYFQVPVLAIWMPVKKAINQEEYRAKPLKWCLKRKFIFKHRTQTKNWAPFFPKIQHFWGFFDKTVQLLTILALAFNSCFIFWTAAFAKQLVHLW